MSRLRIASGYNCITTLFWRIKETFSVRQRLSTVDFPLQMAGSATLKVSSDVSVSTCLNEKNAAKKCINCDGDLGSHASQGSWSEHSVYGCEPPPRASAGRGVFGSFPVTSVLLFLWGIMKPILLKKAFLS